jgi:hypothetical protein
MGGRSLLLLSLTLLAVLTPTAALATTIEVDALFGANSRSIWSAGPGFSHDTGPRFLGPDPWSVGKKIGGVECFLGACAGAEIGATTSGKAGVGYGLKVDSGTFDIQYPLRATFDFPSSVAVGAGSVPTVTVHTAQAPMPLGAVLPTSPGGPLAFRTAQLQVRGPALQAFVELAAEFHAFAGARVCIVICTGPALGPIDVGDSKEIAAINRGGDGAIRVLGTTVAKNQSVSALGGLVNARFNIPDLSSSSTSTFGGFDGVNLASQRRDSVAVVNANLAQIAANGAGLPIPLSGKLGPIGYNLLQANAGAFIDLQARLEFTPTTTVRLLFSSPVVPVIGGVDQPLASFMDIALGGDVTFKPKGLGAVGISPILMLGGDIHTHLDLVLGGSVDVKALGLNVAGLTLGPLIDEKLASDDLGSITLLDQHFGLSLGEVTTRPFNMAFPGCVHFFDSTEVGGVTGVCAISGYGGGGTFGEGDGFQSEGIDFFSCSAAPFGTTPFCGEFLTDFTSPYYRSVFGDAFIGSAEARTFDRIFPGGSTSDASQLADIAALGGSGARPFVIPEGDPLSAFPAPGPASAALLGLGVAGALAARAGAGRRGRP